MKFRYLIYLGIGEPVAGFKDLNHAKEWAKITYGGEEGYTIVEVCDKCGHSRKYTEESGNEIPF